MTHLLGDRWATGDGRFLVFRGVHVIAPCFMGFCARERRSPRREGYLSENECKKLGFENRAFCKVGSVLSGTLLRARICLSVVVVCLLRSNRLFCEGEMEVEHA